MKVCPVESLLESGKYVLKRNPWFTMWTQGKVAYLRKAPEECILSKVPPWAKSRGYLEARPEGVEAVNNIMAYIWSQLDDIHPGYRTAITNKVMDKIMDLIEKGTEIDTATIDEYIKEAISELAKELGVTVDYIKTSGTKRKKTLEAREKRRKTLIAVGKRVGERLKAVT